MGEKKAGKIRESGRMERQTEGGGCFAKEKTTGFKFKVNVKCQNTTLCPTKASILMIFVTHMPFTAKRASSGGFDATDGSLQSAKSRHCFIKKIIDSV